MPPFGWLQTGSVSRPSPALPTNWPFYARNIFAEMGIEPVDYPMDESVYNAESAESINNKMTTLQSLGFSDAETNIEILKANSYDIDRSINQLLELNAAHHEPSESEIDNKMEILLNLGFTDVELNKEALQKNAYDIDGSVNHLLAMGAMSNQPTESEILINNKLSVLSSLGLSDVEMNKQILKQYSCDLDATVEHLLNAMVGSLPERIIKEMATVYLNDYQGQLSVHFRDDE